ncbi:uncharacterized protein L201_004590 [Kwoniella dendrophila CBS 6074]|uniref:Prokaryotic-type class I peptide chain release factors domain-containing protein n=1 Tax=Kwoniella dendrophila CBS 6074 TaxID=1295534 RepID=A0AAX4JW42_9TREE
MIKPMIQHRIINAPSTIHILSKSFTTHSRYHAKASSELLGISSLIKESDHILAREWIDNFKLDDIPKESYIITRSRSSGPGGQHVNKTESKVTLRLDLTKSKGNWLPKFVFEPLTKSPYYLSNPPSILISSQNSKTAFRNQNDTLKNLYETIKFVTEKIIINPTSFEQKQKVRGYIKKENEKRIEFKKRHSLKKASRKDFD